MLAATRKPVDEKALAIPRASKSQFLALSPEGKILALVRYSLHWLGRLGSLLH